jgi:hypothetical protein
LAVQLSRAAKTAKTAKPSALEFPWHDLRFQVCSLLSKSVKRWVWQNNLLGLVGMMQRPSSLSSDQVFW